jgi:hypothetical protein
VFYNGHVHKPAEQMSKQREIEDTAEPDFGSMTEADFLCHLVRQVNDQSNLLQPSKRMQLSMALYAPDREV